MGNPKYRAWDGFRMTTSGIQFNSSTGELEFAPDGVLIQCTGIKDKNGVEIWEDDICKARAKDKEWEIIGKVVMEPLELVLETNDYKWPVASMTVLRDIEVIGNIYQNPELLEA